MMSTEDPFIWPLEPEVDPIFVPEPDPFETQPQTAPIIYCEW